MLFVLRHINQVSVVCYSSIYQVKEREGGTTDNDHTHFFSVVFIGRIRGIIELVWELENPRRVKVVLSPSLSVDRLPV